MSTSIVLARMDHREIPKGHADIARSVLFGFVDGLGEADKKNWRVFVNHLFRMDPGEVAAISATLERSPTFHRLHFRMEQAIFDAQEVFTAFDAGFRPWLKVGSGLVDWKEVNGELVASPKSASYTEMDEIAMREFHLSSIAFLRTPRATSTLWPHLSERAREEMIGGVLKRYEK